MNLTNKNRLVFLPFIYYYGLSLAVLIIGVYLLAKLPPTGISLSFASTDKIQYIGPKAEVILSANDSFSSTEIKPEESLNECDSEEAKKIDQFFANKKAPLANHGCDFVEAAQDTKLSPYLVPAIGWCESNGGKVTPQFKNKESYNAWGWGVLDSNDNTRELNAYACDSWSHCIQRVTRGIARKSHLGTEPQDIVKWYTPASVAKGGGDPAKAPWVICVEGTMKQINEVK